MGNSKIFSRGKYCGRYSEFNFDEMNREADDKVSEGDQIGEKAMRFLSDKKKLEDEIDKVEASSLSKEDKENIIAQLDAAIAELQRQYEKDIIEEETEVHESLELQIEAMQEAADELKKQIDSLRSAQMDIAVTNTGNAVDAANEKKAAFEDMKREYVEKLKLQMDQAEQMQRQIRNRRIGGR